MDTDGWASGKDGSPGPELEQCLRAAIAAPSIHNSQPWLFRIHGADVDVLADTRRRLTVADPDGRELMVSVGAALLNLRTAIQAGGRYASVRAFPDPSEPDLAATVTVGPPTSPDPDSMRLAAAIPQRQTNRRPYGSMAIRPAVLDELVRAASAEDGVLVFADPDQRRELRAALLRAEEQLRISPAYRAELTAWTTASPGSGDGIPPESFGPRPELAALAVRDFDPGHAYPRPVARFEADPVLAVLFTSGDEPADWLRAGQALERVLLTATVHGVASAPLTQLVEVAALRQRVSVPGPGLIAQSMLRLGYASRVSATPRRPLSDILVH